MNIEWVVFVNKSMNQDINHTHLIRKTRFFISEQCHLTLYYVEKKMAAFGNISENSSGNNQIYCMSHSLFIIHIACSTAIFVIGVLVNVFSIRAIIRLKLFRDTSVIFTLHLMTVNLVACTLSMVIGVVNSIRSTGIKDTSCRVSGFIIFVLIGVKMCNITLISVSTYLNVTHSVSVKSFFSKTHNVVICLVSTWTLPLFNLSLPLTEVWGEFIVMRHAPWCFPLAGGYGTYLVCFSLVGTMSALFFSYIGILRTVLQSRRKVGGLSQPDPTNRKKNSNKRQLIISVIIMVTSYTILFLPTCILPVADPNYSLGIYVHVILTYFMSSSNIIETLIYSVLHSKIRNGIKSFMMCRR